MAKNETTGWIILIAVVVIGYFLIAGNPFAPSDTDDDMIAPPAGVTCNKDFEASVTLTSRNAFERVSPVNTDDTVEYKVWRMVGNEQIPQASINEGGDLTIGYDEEYLVVLMTNATLGEADIRFTSKTFKVDEACNRPAPTVFDVQSLPSDIDDYFTTIRLEGENTAANRIEARREATIKVEGRFDGQTRTATDTIIVWDVDRNIVDGVYSTLPEVDVPRAHATGAGEIAYAFELGAFEGFQTINAEFEMDIHRNADLGAYEPGYTIYQYQTGYENTRTGEWVATKSLENNDNDLLLPYFTGDIFLTIQD